MVIKSNYGTYYSKKQFKYKYLTHHLDHNFDKEIYDKSDNIKNLYNYDIQSKTYDEITKIIKEIPDTERIIGVLPYKLFDIYMKPVNKQLNYITNDIQTKVDNIMNIIKECCNGDKTIDEKEDIINKHYPNKRKKKNV